MVGRRLVQRQPEKASHAQRVGRAPRDGALRVEAFEVPEEQQPEVSTGRESRPAHHRRIERRALRLDKRVELRRVENPIQSRIERMAGAGRQVGRGHPHRGLLQPPSPFAHRHVRSVVREIDRVDPLSVTFTTGC